MHFFLLVRDKRTGDWVIQADSNSPTVFMQPKGSVVVEADSRTGYRKLCELADQLEGE